MRPDIVFTMLSRRRIVGTAALLVCLVTGAFSHTAMASAAQRFPVIGCADFRYSFANRWSWGFAPARLCQAGPGLIGIDHAHWRSWGKKRATATGSFVDGLGFEYPAQITAYDLRRCAGCDGTRAARSWYRSLHIVSAGGIRAGVMRGPFTRVLFVAPQQRIVTIGDFARRPYSLRVTFVEGYMTSHADRVCFGGRPTPANIPMNAAPAIAQFHPGVDPATGFLIRASEPVGQAIRNAEAEIGC